MNRLMQYVVRGILCVLGIVGGHVTQSALAGTIIGTITYRGPAVDEEFAPTKSPNADYCATLAQSKPELFRKNREIRFLRTIDVRENGALKDAVVSVRDLVDDAFIARFSGTEIVIQQCLFQPYTSVVVDKRNFRVVNLDPTNHAVAQAVMHNPHGFEVAGPASRTLFNIALADKDAELNRPVALRSRVQGSMIKLVCDQHPYMQSWFLPVTNPYYAVTRTDGRFEIQHVPAGRRLLRAWHPRIGSLDVEILVPPEGSVHVDLELPVK
ncbi:MAG: hypothetical protein OEV51_03535 [Nitrospira sp.]|nr:hypothetical protein [Nitrospira sp.]